MDTATERAIDQAIAAAIFFVIGLLVGSVYEAKNVRKSLILDAIEADEAHYCVDNHEWKFQWEQCDG